MSFWATFSPMFISVSSAGRGIYNESEPDDSARADLVQVVGISSVRSDFDLIVVVNLVSLGLGVSLVPHRVLVLYGGWRAIPPTVRLVQPSEAIDLASAIIALPSVACD
jgi:hypothetical protein